MKKKILFATISNLPTNPRLLKEIDLFGSDYDITVILFRLGNWSDSIDNKLRKLRPQINFVILDVTRTNYFIWMLWAIAEKTARIIWPFIKSNLFVSALAFGRRSIMLMKQIANMERPDVIIAHNLGALYPAFYWSKKLNIPFIYDIEDFDPGIKVPDVGKNYISLSELLLKKCLPSAKYITSASPLIGKYTLQLIGGHSNHHVILNSFLNQEFYTPIKRNDKLLKLVWFSQKISFGRGLEQLLKALENSRNLIKMEGQIILTLIGDLDNEFDKQIIQPFLNNYKLNSSKLHITIIHYPPLQQEKLHFELSNHDIGLALEPGKDLNNTLAISNKIIAYTQAGLFIMATDTAAQKEYMQQKMERGIICGQSVEAMENTILYLLNNLEMTKIGALSRFHSAHNLSWENESDKLKKLLIETIENF